MLDVRLRAMDTLRANFGDDWHKDDLDDIMADIQECVHADPDTFIIHEEKM